MVAVMTLCGRISPASIGSPEDRHLLEQLRLETDGSLLGAGSLREADPEMRGPGGVLSPNRLRAIITGSGNVPSQNKKIFCHGPRPLVFTSSAIREALADKLAGMAEVVGVEEGIHGLSLHDIFNDMARRGAASVLLEGGGILNYAALAQGVVDEISLTITPKLSGDRAASSLISGPAPLGNPFQTLRLLSCERTEYDELICRYRVKPTSTKQST